MDRSPIGVLAAQLMDEVEKNMGDGEGAVGAVGLIVEANTASGESRIFTMFNDTRVHVRLGMLDFARAVVLKELDY
ncbi:MAG: hypothetical protein ACRDLP_00565 [Solirubrobacteraceae bacterium]